MDITEALTEIILGIGRELPLLALMMFFHTQYRRDCEARIDKQEKVIEKYQERDHELTDKAMERLFSDQADDRRNRPTMQ